MSNYIKYDTQNLASSQEEEDVPASSEVVAARSKAKAKPKPRESTGTTSIPLSERVWIDIEPSKPDLESYNLSKKVINLLRHNQKLHREQDGAVQFYKIKFHLRDYSLPIQNWLDNRWLACLAARGGPKRRYQYCSDYLGSIIYLRALQGHSGDNIIDLAMQDHVLSAPGVFPYIYHVGSNFNISSILSNGLRAERFRNGEKLNERQYLSPRPPPKISLRHDLNWTRRNDELGSTVEHRPVGKLVQQSLGETVQFGSSKPTQSPKTNEDRSGKPVAQEIVSVLQEELSSSDRTEKPVTEEEQHVRNHDNSGKPEREEIQHTVQENYHLKSRDNVDKFDLATDDANVDFSVSGIPDEAVKRSQNFNILQLIRRITRHPQKQAVQNDLDKEQSFNAFSDESKQAIKEAGNIEISEIVNAEPKWQCKYCLNHCNPGVIYCVCGRLMTTDSTENRKSISGHPRHILYTEFLHQKRQTTWSQVWKSSRMQRIPYSKSTCKEMP